jgi:hypothetical protein
VNSEPVATGAEPAAQRSVNDLAPVNALEGARERTPKNGIAITDAAVTYAKEKLAKRGTPDAAIRLGIKGGGCSGFQVKNVLELVLVPELLFICISFFRSFLC